MRNSTLVKPNLKLILLGAMLIAVLHDVFTQGMSEPSSHYQASWFSAETLDELIEEVEDSPNSHGYRLISETYEKRGDTRNALHYMQKADAIGRFEGPLN